MKLMNFMEISNFEKEKQAEQATLLCYFHYRNTGEDCFDMKAIGALFIDAGMKPINGTHVKNGILKRGKMRIAYVEPCRKFT